MMCADQGECLPMANFLAHHGDRANSALRPSSSTIASNFFVVPIGAPRGKVIDCDYRAAKFCGALFFC